MIIHCANNLQAGQIVNQVGKYLYKHLDGAFKFDKSSNMCDVYFLLLYQREDSPDMHEMHIDLNITTYQNKIRVNILEVTPEERTLGYNCYEPEVFSKDLESGKERIYNNVVRKVSKAYQDYEFIF